MAISDDYSIRDNIIHRGLNSSSQFTLDALRDKIADALDDLETGTMYVFGDESTDGSWRLTVVSNELLIQNRITGTWTTRSKIT